LSKREKIKAWKTRTRGTLRQIGKRFPITDAKALLKSLPTEMRQITPERKLESRVLTVLEKGAIARAEALKRTGYKGWTIGIKYKDGTTEQIPVIARNCHQALRMAAPKMNQRPENVDEIVIIDPSIKEVLHKIGAGAARLVKKAAPVAKEFVRKGVRYVRETVPIVREGIVVGTKVVTRAIPAGIKKAAYVAGRVVAFPEEVKEAYRIGRKPRPFAPQEPLVKDKVFAPREPLIPMERPVPRIRPRETVIIEEVPVKKPKVKIIKRTVLEEEVVEE